MKKFNIYCKGCLIIKEDESLINIKSELKKDKTFVSDLNKLKTGESLLYMDPKSLREWEYERVL